MRRLLAILSLCAVVAGCKQDAPDASGEGGPNGHPILIMEALFSAAKSGDTELLAGLCDPQGVADPEVRALCAMTADSSALANFKAAYATGKLVSPVVMSGPLAQVRFQYGTQGEQQRIMEFVERNGKWYLARFSKAP